MLTLHTYQDKAFKWRWRLKAANGQIIADSAQGYASERNVRRAARMVADKLRAGVLMVDDGRH